jgi:predicted dithiol-disulfide oxidoreductase (DUF899 family)
MQAIDVGHKVVSNGEWIEARKAFLAKEKELTRMRDRLAQQRMELPWRRVAKEYVFEGPQGKERLADLFGGKSQLMVYHFMFGPGWEAGCPSCSIVGDNMNGNVVHLADRDVTLLAVSRATFPEIERFKRRMGWGFKWVSSHGSDFNWDFNVSFTKEDMERGKVHYNYADGYFPSEEGPGMSVFYKDESGEIFHTYSTFARGGEPLVGVYNFLDLVPKGRGEDGFAFPMAWVRHHDRYEGQSVNAEEAASCCGAGELA